VVEPGFWVMTTLSENVLTLISNSFFNCGARTILSATRRSRFTSSVFLEALSMFGDLCCFGLTFGFSGGFPPWAWGYFVGFFFNTFRVIQRAADMRRSASFSN